MKEITTPFNQTMLLASRWGHMIGLACDPYQTGSLAVYGEWAHDELEAICEFLQPGDVALDVGANIGTMAIGMAKRVGPNGLVLAFEPQRAPFLCLCGSVALCHVINQVRCFQTAIGDHEGSILVPVVDLSKSFNVGGVRLDDQSYTDAVKLNQEEVPLMTIDSLELPRCNLIKIDVEAMEAKVLAGAAATVERCRPVIFAEALRNDSFREGSTIEDANLKQMLLFFEAHHYEPRFLETTVCPDTNARFAPDVLFEGHDRNIVALPNELDKPEWFQLLPDAR